MSIAVSRSIERPRVVVTGMGVVAPMGIGVDVAWEAAVSGESGIRRIQSFDSSEFPCQIGGEVLDFKPSDYVDRRKARRMSRSSQMGVAAWRMGMDAAGLDTLPDPSRTGVMMGISSSALDKLDDAITLYRQRGWERVNPFALANTLPNMPTYHITVESGAKGHIGTQVAACASGVQGVGEGAELIWRNRADVVIAGGADATVHSVTFAGFCAMRGMPVNFNDAPERASRPFDASREGFLLSEGAGVLVLESLEHAVGRGAKIIAEIVGYGAAADAHHIAAPDPDGGGAVRAMTAALHDADLLPTDVDYINAHGSSTPMNGKIETNAIKQVFGDHAYQLAVSSTKSVMGHAMGASGAMETIFCAKALQTGIVPPTINYETADPDCDLDYVPNVARACHPNVAMCNGFGLGGQNAVLILRKWV